MIDFNRRVRGLLDLAADNHVDFVKLVRHGFHRRLVEEREQHDEIALPLQTGQMPA
jgi:hypothetical protein